MNFDFAGDKREHFAHLVSMAVHPGSKDHAWFRAKEMARENPDLYGDMPDLLIAEVKRLAAPSEIHRT